MVDGMVAHRQTVLERSLRVLHPDVQAAGREKAIEFWACLEHLKSQSPLPETYFLQKGHILNISSKLGHMLQSFQIVPLPMSLWGPFSFNP